MLFSGTVPDYLLIYVYFISRSPEMLFSGTVPDYLFIYVYFISRSTEILCFQSLCTLQDRFISMVSFLKQTSQCLE